MSKLEDVAALLRGEQPQPEVQTDERRSEEETGGHEAETSSEQPAAIEAKEPERQTVRTLAEKLGVKESEVYGLLDIGLPNDKHYTLGELKDLAVQGIGLTKTTAKLEKDATDLLVQRRELQMVAEKMAATGRISQAEVDEMRQTEEKRLAAEVQNFRRSVPSWDDPVIRSRETSTITEHARAYGLSMPEFEKLVTDARLMKLIRDAAINKPEQKPVIQPRKAPQQAARTGNSRRDTISQVAALLRG